MSRTHTSEETGDSNQTWANTGLRYLLSHWRELKENTTLHNRRDADEDTDDDKSDDDDNRHQPTTDHVIGDDDSLWGCQTMNVRGGRSVDDWQPPPTLVWWRRRRCRYADQPRRVAPQAQRVTKLGRCPWKQRPRSSPGTADVTMTTGIEVTRRRRWSRLPRTSTMIGWWNDNSTMMTRCRESRS
jgi:hypothetical protein